MTPKRDKNAAHTPGPWSQHGPGSVRVCDGAHDSDAGCRTIAEAEIIGVPRPEALANARLIAAAPNIEAENAALTTERDLLRENARRSADEYAELARSANRRERDLEAEIAALRKAGSELLMELALHALGGETILKDNPKVVAMRAALTRIPEPKP